jgi:hypothetical protein
VLVGVIVSRREVPSAQPLGRLVVAVGSAALILAPWVYGLARTGDLHRPPSPEAVLPLWRALLAVPATLPGAGGLPGTFAAATSVAILVGAMVVAFRQRPAAVAALVLVIAVSGLAAWGITEARPGWLWPPALLLPTALAYGGLAVLTGRCLAGSLADYSFGARQLAVVAVTLVVALGLLGSVVRVGTGPWTGIVRAPELVPAFVAADEPRVGPYRVLLLDQHAGEVRWDVVGAGGPSMVAFGSSADRALLEHYDGLVAALAGAADPRAGAQLGVANVRYLVVTDHQDEQLIAALGRQPALEPLPSGGGRVFRVQTWLPRAVVLPPAPGEALLATGDPGPTGAFEEQGLTRVRADVYRGALADPEPGGVLVVSEAASELWRAGGADVPLERAEIAGVNAFRVPPGTPTITARVAGGLGHRLAVGLQLLAALVVLSLALRPPRFGREREPRLRRALPSDLDAIDDPQPAEPTPGGPA